MKIQSVANIQKVMGAYGKTVSKVEKNKNKSFPTDKIEISKEAREFQVAMKAFNNLPEIREDKVSLISQQINSGKYAPSSDDVAQKILDMLSK